MLKLDRTEYGFLDRYADLIVTIDSHTQGEPTRLLINGVGSLPGSTIEAKRDHFESRYDHVRKLLTREPRGDGGIMAAVVTEPVSQKGSFGLFYMDARRYPYLCGHAIIGAVATLIETGALDAEDGDAVITVDTPSEPFTVRHRHYRQNDAAPPSGKTRSRPDLQKYQPPGHDLRRAHRQNRVHRKIWRHCRPGPGKSPDNRLSSVCRGYQRPLP